MSVLKTSDTPNAPVTGSPAVVLSVAVASVPSMTAQ